MRESKFYQEIMEEGRVEMKRANIGEVFEARFGAEAAAEFREMLGDVTDLNKLSRLLRLASRCNHLADFRRTFRSIARND